MLMYDGKWTSFFSMNINSDGVLFIHGHSVLLQYYCFNNGIWHCWMITRFHTLLCVDSHDKILCTSFGFRTEKGDWIVKFVPAFFRDQCLSFSYIQLLYCLLQLAWDKRLCCCCCCCWYSDALLLWPCGTFHFCKLYHFMVSTFAIPRTEHIYSQFQSCCTKWKALKALLDRRRSSSSEGNHTWL